MDKIKKVLGRGLSSILSNKNNSTLQTKNNTQLTTQMGLTSELLINTIDINPYQPRTNFNLKGLKELELSIKELGVIQPITVRKIGYNKYQLISGERRIRASKMAGLNKIPSHIIIANDKEMLEMALVENIQRQNLDAIEIALGGKP